MKKSGSLKRNATMRRQTRLNKVNERKKAKRKAKYDAYLRSPEWKAKRKACIEAAGHRCEHAWKTLEAWFDDPGLFVGQEITKYGDKWRCTETTRLTAHHLTYARFGRELPEDLQCLCRKCHEYVEAMKGKHRYSKRAG